MFLRVCVYVRLCATVLYEKAGDQIAHVKFTVLLQSGGTTKITGLPVPSGFEVSCTQGHICLYLYVSVQLHVDEKTDVWMSVYGHTPSFEYIWVYTSYTNVYTHITQYMTQTYVLSNIRSYGPY